MYPLPKNKHRFYLPIFLIEKLTFFIVFLSALRALLYALKYF